MPVECMWLLWSCHCSLTLGNSVDSEFAVVLFRASSRTIFRVLLWLLVNDDDWSEQKSSFLEFYSTKRRHFPFKGIYPQWLWILCLPSKTPLHTVKPTNSVRIILCSRVYQLLVIGIGLVVAVDKVAMSAEVIRSVSDCIIATPLKCRIRRVINLAH